MPTGTGKGVALQHAACFFGLTNQNVLAFGDSFNDLSMLDGRHGFRAGTVLNADPVVRQTVNDAGGYAALCRASEGVLEALNEYAAQGLLILQLQIGILEWSGLPNLY